MLLRTYFVIGSAGQQPYEAVMPKLLAPKLACAALLVAFACGCSRGKAGEGQAAPAVSAAPGASTLLAVGAPAPDVTFALHTGEKLALSSLRGKPVVVYFYPKDDTPGCTIEAQEIRDLYTQLKQTGAVVIGVSTDALDSHRAFAEKHALPFLLAADEAGELAKAFGVPLKNGRATRVSFVIGADGRIKRSFPAVTPKGHAAELLAAISS
jgi:thioredoxin-dependent peroxiredoxin